jgi:hypothetical protein
MPNRKKPRFLENVVSDLAVLHKSIKDFLFTENFRSARAMDPWVGLRDKQVSTQWGVDPVHVRQEHYGPIVEGLRITADKIANNGNAKKRMSGLGGGDQKRSRMDHRQRGTVQLHPHRNGTTALSGAVGYPFAVFFLF